MFEHFDAAYWLVVGGDLGGVCEVAGCEVEHLRLLVRTTGYDFGAVLRREMLVLYLQWSFGVRVLLTMRNLALDRPFRRELSLDCFPVRLFRIS